MGTNSMLRDLQNCDNIYSLAAIYMNEENVPRQVWRRAHFKLAQIWAKKDKAYAAAKKARATKEKNKKIESQKIQEFCIG